MKTSLPLLGSALLLALFAAPSRASAAIPEHEDTFLTPGLLQGRVAGSANFTDPISSSDIALRRELGPIMGLFHTSPNGNNEYGGYQSEIDAVKTYWDFNVTFVYVGRIYLDASKVYAFGSRIDDSATMKIDGDVLYSYTGGGACRSVRYEPTWTGWHDVEIRCGNGAGMAGRNSPYCAIGKIGFCYCSADKDSPEAATIADHTCSGSVEETKWIKMIDDGLGTLFGTSPTTGFLDAVKVSYIGVHEGSLYVTVLPEIQEEVNVWIWYGPDYGGIDKASWGQELWVGKTDGSGTMPVSNSYGLPAGTEYVRFVATGYRDGTHKWAGETFAVADLPEAEFDPQVTCSRDAATATPFSVDMVVDVAYPGYGATEWTATLVYGPGEKDVATVSGSGSGQQRIHLDDLMGGYSYLGTLTVATDAGRSSTLSNVDVSTAAEPSLGLLPGLMQGLLEGTRNLTDGLDASTNEVRRELGPVMGLITDRGGYLYNSPVYYTSELDGVKSYWAGQVTYLYQGQIYLDATKEYAFGARNDDSCDIKIDGETVIEKGNCAHTTTPYIPTYTGWHSIDIRSGNNGGWAGANPYCPIGYKGIVYNDEGRCDHTCQNTHEDEDWWWPLKDAGDGTLLGTPGEVTRSDGLSIVSATRGLGSVSATVEVSVADSVTLYAWSGATYGGTDADAWDAVTGALGSHGVLDGASPLRVHVPIASDTQYVRLFAVSTRDASLVWTSPTIPVSSLANESGISVLFR